MARQGSTYKVTKVLNPLGEIFPTRVYPLYSLVTNDLQTQQLYRQIHDRDGIIQDFLEAPEYSPRQIYSTDTNYLYNGIFQEAVHGFAWSANDVRLVRGLSEFRDLLQLSMSGKDRRNVFNNPMIGVEVSRFLHDERLEAVCTGLVVRELTRHSARLAEGWLKTVPLSDFARRRGLKILKRLGGYLDPIIDPYPDVRTIALSSRTLIQGDFVQEFHDGTIEVIIGRRIYRGIPTVKLKALPQIVGLNARSTPTMIRKRVLRNTDYIRLHENMGPLNLLEYELFRELASEGVRLQVGELFEDILTEGIDLFNLPIGTWVRFGKEVILELLGPLNIQAQVELIRSQNIYNKPDIQMMIEFAATIPREMTSHRNHGIGARVIKSGIVRLGQPVEVIDSRSFNDGGHAARPSIGS